MLDGLIPGYKLRSDEVYTWVYTQVRSCSLRISQHIVGADLSENERIPLDPKRHPNVEVYARLPNITGIDDFLGAYPWMANILNEEVGYTINFLSCVLRQASVLSKKWFGVLEFHTRACKSASISSTVLNFLNSPRASASSTSRSPACHSSVQNHS